MTIATAKRTAFLAVAVGLLMAGCVTKPAPQSASLVAVQPPVASKPDPAGQPLYLSNPDDTADNPLDQALSGNQDPPPDRRAVRLGPSDRSSSRLAKAPSPTAVSTSVISVSL